MAFNVSMTRDGVTYEISGNTFAEFVADFKQVEGLEGFICAIAEVHRDAAERAVEPIAASVEDHGQGCACATCKPVERQDELADLIRSAPDVNALAGLWRAHKARWNADYNRLAEKRKKELSK